MRSKSVTVRKFHDFFITPILYVKLILVILKVLKLPFLQFLGSEYCEFGQFQP